MELMKCDPHTIDALLYVLNERAEEQAAALEEAEAEHSGTKRVIAQ